MTRWVKLVPDWIIRPRWLIIGVLVFFVVSLEIAESIVRGINFVDGTEMMVYVSFLVSHRRAD